MKLLQKCTFQMDYADNHACCYAYDNHACCFANDNHACCYGNDVSAVCYDKYQVSIHPMIIYCRYGDGAQNIAGIREEKVHTMATTTGFMQVLQPQLKEILPELTRVRYVTDLPSSQYRNKTVVAICIMAMAGSGSRQRCRWSHQKDGRDGLEERRHIVGHIHLLQPFRHSRHQDEVCPCLLHRSQRPP